MKPFQRIATLIILISIALAFTPRQVRADIAPPPIPVIGGLGTVDYQKTNVEMAAERVEMEYYPYKYEEAQHVTYIWGVMVNAWFTMKNTGDQDETMQVVFPLSDMIRCSIFGDDSKSYTHLDFTTKSFSAQVNDEPVNTKTITTDYPGDQKNCSDYQIDWAAFDVTFPAGENTLIRISYFLDFMGSDDYLNVGYTLETGAAWKGPIGEATIVFRFPNVVQDDFIMPGTTTGYQVMQNEIYWQYHNFEPTHQDNISAVFIAPYQWSQIIESRHRIQVNAKDDAAWAQLAQIYSNIAHFHGPNIRSKEYNQRAYSTYEEGLKANPNSASLHAGLANLITTDCCFYNPGSQADYDKIVLHLQKALDNDPSNPDALELLDILRRVYPNIAITIGPTFTATITTTPNTTSTSAHTDTHTPSPTAIEETLPPTWTITVTRTPIPTGTPSPTHPAVTQTPTLAITPQSGTTSPLPGIAILIPVMAFIAGIGIGRITKRKSVQ